VIVLSCGTGLIRLSVELSWPSSADGLVFRLANDAVEEHLEESDATPIIGVDVPNHSFRQHVVLTESNQLSERCRCQPRQENAVRGRARPICDAAGDRKKSLNKPPHSSERTGAPHG